MNMKMFRSILCISFMVVLLASVIEIMPVRANDSSAIIAADITDSGNYISLLSEATPAYTDITQDTGLPQEGEINIDGQPDEEDAFDYSKIALLKWVGPGEPGTFAEYQQSEPKGPLNISAVTPQPQMIARPQGAPRILLICNSALYPSIQTRLTTYATDVTARGYQVDLYQFTSGTAENLKSYIQGQSLDLAGCVFVGDVPAAWFEVTNDYHQYGYQSFPCDLFLMDLDGSWTDADSDGIYDEHGAGTGDEGPEIFVARIDASRMSGDQATLTNNYFDRLHTYYDGTIRRTLYGLTYTEDDWSNGTNFLNDIGYAYGEYDAVAAPDTSRDDYLNNRLLSTTYEFIQLACHSNSSGCSFTRGGWLSSSDVRNAPPRAMLYNLFCCSATRFTSSDCLGCSYIFNNSDSSLAVVGSTKIGSMLQFSKFYQPFGQGETFGNAFQDWFDSLAPYDEYELYWHYGMNIIGDPMITVCSQTATAPPQLTNSDGANNITADSARLNGELTDLGGDFPHVYIYYGTVDGGTTAENWQGYLDAGYRNLGTFYKDLTYLMPDTDYYYRCYASNSAGEAWADASSQFTTLPGQKILGADDADITSTMGANYLVLARFHALAYGRVSQIRIKCSGPGYVRVNLYEDYDGEPGGMINWTDPIGEYHVTAGWNSIPLPYAYVWGSRYFWLAFISNAPIVGSSGNTGTVRLRAANYSTFSFPNGFPYGYFSTSNESVLIAGWGTTPLMIQEREMYEGSIGVPYYLALIARGGTGSYTWSLARWSLPPGLTLDATTGVISGTPTTTGYFGFIARLDDGLTSATRTTGIRIVSAQQKILGPEDATPTGTIDANTFILSRFIAPRSSTITQFRFNSSGNGWMKGAVYRDDNGTPSPYMAGGNTWDNPVRTGWNDVYLYAPNITEGTAYWLGFISDVPLVGYTSSGGTTKYTSYDFSTWDLPWLTRITFTDSSWNPLISAWGKPPINIDTSTLPAGQPGSPYSYTLQASGGGGDYLWVLYDGSLPPGLTLPLEGVISGTPTASGTFNFTVEAIENGGENSGIKSLSITVVDQPQKIVGTDAQDTGAFASGYVGLSKFSASATGTVNVIRVYGTATGHVKVAIYADNYGQPGTLLNANNNDNSVTGGQWNNIPISDTPVTSGTSYWLGAIMDASNCVTKVVSPNPYRYKSQSYSGFSWPGTVSGLSAADSIYLCIAGLGPPPPLAITTESLPGGNVGAAYSQTLTASGGSGTYTWSIPAGALPDGLSLTPATGLISGTPAVVNTFSFTAQVDDGYTSVTRDLSISINPPTQKLIGTDTSSSGAFAAGYIGLSRFTASANGTVNRIKVYGTASGHVKVAIYSDSGGQPGTLLNANNNDNLVIGGQWNSIIVADTPVTSGTSYWLGAIMDTNSAVTKVVSANPYRYKQQPYITYNWGTTLSGLQTSDTIFLCMAGYGSPAIGYNTYTNEEYSFSLQYPSDWVERPDMLTTPYHLTAFGVPAFVPDEIIARFDADAPITNEWIVSSLELLNCHNPQVLSPITPTTLADGTPAVMYKVGYISATGYEVEAFCLNADNAGSRIHVMVFTVPVFEPYNETLYSEIAHTLLFETEAPQKLVGTDTSDTGAFSEGYIGLSRFTATGTGIVNSIRVFGTATGQVKVAIYSDNNGEPGTLLNANNNSNSVTGGQWNSITITDTPVVSGTNYWLGTITDTTNAVTKVVSPNPYRYKQQTYITYNWETSLSGLKTSDTIYLCIAGYSTSGLPPLEISTIALANGTVATSYSQTLTATGGSGSYTWSIPAGALPDGLSLAPATGVISGTPTIANTFTFTVEVNDGSTTHQHSLAITIDPSPVLGITTSSLPEGTVNLGYSQTLTASGGTGSYTWSISAGSLPDGLSLTPATGVISGTPTVANTFNFTVQVDDGSTQVTKPLSIKINPLSQKLLGTDSAGSGGFAAGYIGLSRFTASATGVVNTIRVYGTASGHIKVAIYSDNGGQPGTLLNANNNDNLVTGAQWNNITIADTPVVSGNNYWLGAIMDTTSAVTKVVSANPYRYKPQEYNGYNWGTTLSGLQTSDTIYLCLSGYGSAGPVPLTITTSSLPDGAIGVGYSQTLAAAGGTGSYTWSIPVGALPDGLSLTPASGLISGTPTVANTFSFTAQVDDGSTSVTGELSITINSNLPSQKLVGTDTADTGGFAKDYIGLSKFMASANGTVNQIRVYGTASGHVKVAIYSDNGGQPGTLLHANDTETLIIGGQWNSITIADTPVTSGTSYWLGVIMDTDSSVTKVTSANPYRYKQHPYAGYNWESTISELKTSDTIYLCIAGWGTAS